MRFDDVPVISTRGRNPRVSSKIPPIGRNDNTSVITYLIFIYGLLFSGKYINFASISFVQGAPEFFQPFLILFPSK